MTLIYQSIALPRLSEIFQGNNLIYTASYIAGLFRKAPFICSGSRAFPESGDLCDLGEGRIFCGGGHIQSSKMSEDESFGSDDDMLSPGGSNSARTTFANEDEKRAHHNALERKRRDHIKHSFNSLRDAVPNLDGKPD